MADTTILILFSGKKLDVLDTIKIDSKTSRFVGCAGSCCLNSVASKPLYNRDSIGELTVIDSTTAFYLPAFAIAFSTVRPRTSGAASNGNDEYRASEKRE